MVTEIGDNINVIALFDRTIKEGLAPVRFYWKGRVYGVDSVTSTWRSTDGAAPIIHFSVLSTFVDSLARGALRAKGSGRAGGRDSGAGEGESRGGDSCLFEVTYNKSSLRWRLERVEA